MNIKERLNYWLLKKVLGPGRSLLIQDTISAPLGSAIETTEVTDNAITLAKMAHGTQGDIYFCDAAGAPARLGVGTSGQYLKTQGAAANPIWATIATDMVFLSSGSHTLAVGNGAIDSNPLDINIGAGDLVATDKLLIYLMTNCPSNKWIQLRVDTENVTAATDGTEISGFKLSGVGGHAQILIMQDQTVNDTIHALVLSSSDDLRNTSNTHDTNDANVFTTAFTIRVNMYFQGAPADITTTINYYVYKIKGA